MKRLFLVIGFVYSVLWVSAEDPLNLKPSTLNISLDDIITDIYNAVTEISEADFEQLQSDLYAIHANPIDLNNTNDEELSQLYFLSPRQIDDILLYADKHGFESLYELRMIASLEDYEIRDLVPFVRVGERTQDNNMYAREVFAHAKHEIITRVDARNIENFEGTDPMYVQTRYRFDYRRRVIFGAQLRRPAGGTAKDLQYGAYLQLNDIGHLHTLVAGNFQASFGQGLVFAQPFHAGKSMYVASAGQQRNGLRYYSSVDGNGLHGAGATFRWNWDKVTRLDVSALYSMKRANDSTWHHLIGTNLTFRHKQLEVQLTATENVWSDSIHPYNNAAYNQHYFRGRNQAVLGASARYNYGWFDAFAEVATSQNQKWGFGVLAGSRFYPTDGVSLIALYRNYSPWFDNVLGYGFSETSRINDEHGGYLGFDVTRLKNWRFSGYGDVFYFSGVKYGIPQAGTIGYDVMAEAKYSVVSSQYSVVSSQLSVVSSQYSAVSSQYSVFSSQYSVSGRLRARKKGDVSTYSARAQFDWSRGPWSLRTTADANLSGQRSAISSQPYGVSIAQDVAFDFSKLSTLNSQLPLALRLRVQWFDAREWANRIYLYEHDVLYAFSIPAIYGLGGRAYVCLKWQIIPQLAMYLRVSETLYDKNWAASHNRSMTRTDIHFLLRAKL